MKYLITNFCSFTICASIKPSDRNFECFEICSRELVSRCIINPLMQANAARFLKCV